MSVKSVSDLRNKLREQGIDYQVAKKTLINLAVKDTKVADFDATKLEGAIAVAFSYEDEVAAAKTIKQYSKDEDKVQIVAGIMEGKLLSKEEVEQLASLPSKQELYAKVVGTMNAPVSGFVRVCAGPLSAFARVVGAYKEKLEG